MKTFSYEKQPASRSNTIDTAAGGIKMPAVPIQRQGPVEEEKPVQGKFVAQLKGPEEEEPLQGKFTTQLKGPEEEEPVQGKLTTQLQGAEEEEPVQGKFTTQLKGPEEEEPVQGKFTTQLQGAEEEEPVQGKFTTQLKGPEEEEPVQGKFTAQLKGEEEEEPAQMKTVQLAAAEEELPVQKKKNNTGLPDNLKSGVESLSGYAMDDVKVHYNSSKPAQLNAHAYAQGTDIHVASGQEKHLPHEAWHVVQQKQGRVQPTLQMKEGVAVNDDKGLENEADVMGAKAVQMKAISNSLSTVQRLILMKDVGTPAERSRGGNARLRQDVTATINSRSRQGMLDTIAQLQTSIAARANDPAGVAGGHLVRLNLERAQLVRLQTAYNAMPVRARRRRGNVQF
ncbi:DUF4157 domain-containing protein [Mucilaginibacter sp. HMF5004]|uniref:eCIS core domain-containing protein n=1 Tax=Mucilaginibacter rivuli TaxID=2857527 RepID=UPI001C5D2B46|nr:DUF4157 domain-containing protein [Mucilaginibacter rivuli]MBW4891584.1 DUF4157 domain-containing protein [Mucilaginibacter rivuli]